MVIEKHFDTLKQMFFEEGIKSFTMDVICRKLGIAKKTLYKEFANKKELVNAIFHKEFYCFKLNLTLALNNSEDAIQQLCILFDFFYRRQNALSYASLFDLGEYYQSLNSEIIDLENQLIIEKTNSILKQGIAESNFREDIIPELIGEIFTFLFATGIMLRKNKIHQNLFSFADIHLLDFQLRSICTPLGLKLWNTKHLTIHTNN
jgi:TetR/AcrR family transcriptional regulator, cholesterol catabolism regulator